MKGYDEIIKRIRLHSKVFYIAIESGVSFGDVDCLFKKIVDNIT